MNDLDFHDTMGMQNSLYVDVAATEVASKVVATLFKLNTLKFNLYGHNNGL